MGVQSKNSDPWKGDAEMSLHPPICYLNGAKNTLFGDPLRYFSEREVGGHKNNLPPRSDKHHRHRFGPGEMSQQLRMARKGISCPIDGLFINRAGGHGIDPALHDPLDCQANRIHHGFPALPVWFSDLERFGMEMT